MSALFARYAQLAGRLPHVPLGLFPTPVERLGRLGAALGAGELYVKRDDLSGEIYGGNKIRKLEFLLAEAVRAGAREVLTFGFAGSNHATATAVYARRVGLKSISLLIPQPAAEYVRRNLLLSFASGAELHHYPHAALLGWGAAYECWRHRRLTGVAPHVIAPGGTTALGNVGYVNAAFELQEQVEAGLLPEPDVIYVAAGTMGTVAGLLLGLRAAKMKARVVAVRVVDEKFTSAGRLGRLCERTARLLHAADASFPPVTPNASDISLRHEFYGAGYAVATDESRAAIALTGEAEGLRLDQTYTGKAFAALAADARRGELRGKVALFWNTYNSRDFSPPIAAADYHRLPRALHRYFTGNG